MLPQLRSLAGVYPLGRYLLVYESERVCLFQIGAAKPAIPPYPGQPASEPTPSKPSGFKYDTSKWATLIRPKPPEPIPSDIARKMYPEAYGMAPPHLRLNRTGKIPVS